MESKLDIFDLQAQLCQSLSNPIRLRIIHTLKESPKSVNEIAAELKVSQSSISRHLSVLRSTGLLSAHRKAQEVFYEIRNPKIVEVCEMMRCILNEREAEQLDLLHRIQT
jgi:DNA-binding transcriptional ArsR family regulator